MLSSRTSSPAVAAPKSPRVHYIDGVRAFAALSVVVLHILQMRGLRLETAGVIPGFDYSGGLADSLISDLMRVLIAVFLNFGTLAVKLFIVISGYTIMLSVVRSKDGLPKGGIKGYMWRRIKRIWPPYYAGLAISLLIIFLIPGMNQLTYNRFHDIALPVTVDNVLSHVFFVHTWNPDWAQKINTPMWSIAVEEQIYILFPLVLLPFWRRFKSWHMILAAAVVGWLPMLVLPYETYHSTRAWFLILFAIGATGASISFSIRPGEQTLRQRVPWPLLGMGVLLAWAVIKFGLRFVVADADTALHHLEPFTDILFGTACVTLLIHLTEVWKRGAPKVSLFSVFNSPLAVKLGVFSYSIYLMHTPILSVLTQVLMSLGISGDLFYVLMFVIGFPLAIAFCYGFFWLFERPFMPQAALQPRAQAIQPSLATD